MSAKLRKKSNRQIYTEFSGYNRQFWYKFGGLDDFIA